MKRLLALVTIMLLFVAACGGEPTPSTEATVQATIGAVQAPRPPETPTPTPELSPTPQPTPTSEPTQTPTATPKPTATPEPVEMVATGNVDVFLSPDGQRVGYFVPGQTFTPTGRQEAGFIEVASGEDVLWVEGSAPYCPLADVPTPTPSPVPPTPTLVPDRTEFRRTGQYDWDGQIVPEWQYQVGWMGEWAGKPTIGARIVAVDVETGVLTFDIGDQRTIQGRLAAGGRFQIEDSVRTGPTRLYGIVAASIYDFQVGDAVWIKGNSQDELQGNVPGVVELLTISGLR